MKYDVIGVGNVAYDYLCIVEDYPKEDSSTHILQIVNQCGGCVGTSLVSMQRLGISSCYIGNIGNDDAGRIIQNDFLKEGVGIDGLDVLQDGHSSLGFVMIDPNHATRTKFPYRDNLADIEWTDKKKELIQNAKILHIDGTHYNNCMQAIEIAKANNVLVSLDGCSKKEDNSLNVDIARNADILIMNSAYPFYTSNKESLKDAFAFFANFGAKYILTTRGEDGCIAYVDNEIREFPAFKVNAVDTTGAGDAFHGGFIAAILKGYPLLKAIEYASAVSAINTLQIGGRIGLPTHQEVEDFIQSHQI